ncbi:MAG: ROK family protein [Chloroflexota bacterium]|nr:ROK family protein [Chloroflexota bacterium]
MTQASELAVAMDWGGTWIRVGVLDRDGQILWQDRVGHARGTGKDELLGLAEGLLRQAIDWCAPRAIAGIGVAIAGPVEPENGTMYQPPNLPVLDGVSLKPLWESNLGYPVWVGNDANLAALGEFHLGAGRTMAKAGMLPKTLVYLTISTGIGGGVIEQGKMLLGADGLAAEIGHMCIDSRDDAIECQCGVRGCLEALASGTAIANITRERIARGGFPSSTLTSESDSMTSATVLQAAGQGDSLAVSIVDGVVFALSVGLANVLHLYNPDLIVLGGGVTSGLVELDLLPRIQERVKTRAMSDLHKEFRLVASHLGDDPGMVGAATLVWQNA